MHTAYRNLPAHSSHRPGKGTKILFATLAADGHFNPLTSLALHLIEAGYDVRWYVGSAYAGKLRTLGIPHFPHQKALDVTVENIDDYFPERTKLKSGIAKLKFDLCEFFIKRAPDFYTDLQAIHHVFPFEVLVADICFTAIPYVREKMKIPVVTIGVIPVAETSKDLAPMGLGLTPATSVVGRVKQAALRFITDAVLLRQPIKILSQLLAKEGIARDGNMFDTLYRKSTVVLQSGTPGFEYNRSDLNPNLHFIGALLPAQTTGTKPAWDHPKLKQYKKLVLVTQGTAEGDVEKLLVPTLEALKDSDYLVVATTAGNKTAELQQRFPHPNIIIDDFIPFAAIMPHAALYISNGGYGGVMLAIQHRLPMVVAGVNEGKNEICARVGYFKLGINLKTEKPTAAQITKSVETVLATNMYRQNVQTLAREFDRYNPQALFAQHIETILHQKAPKVAYEPNAVSAEIY